MLWDGRSGWPPSQSISIWPVETQKSTFLLTGALNKIHIKSSNLTVNVILLRYKTLIFLSYITRNCLAFGQKDNQQLCCIFFFVIFSLYYRKNRVNCPRFTRTPFPVKCCVYCRHATGNGTTILVKTCRQGGKLVTKYVCCFVFCLFGF